jgi:hypothetical protein
MTQAEMIVAVIAARLGTDGPASPATGIAVSAGRAASSAGQPKVLPAATAATAARRGRKHRLIAVNICACRAGVEGIGLAQGRTAAIRLPLGTP